MEKVFSKSQARRRWRRIMKLVQHGAMFVITRLGKPVCKICPPE